MLSIQSSLPQLSLTQKIAFRFLDRVFLRQTLQKLTFYRDCLLVTTALAKPKRWLAAMTQNMDTYRSHTAGDVGQPRSNQDLSTYASSK